MAAELIALSVLALDLPVPAAGWPAELVVLDDLGRASVPREVARSLFAEHREAEARAAHRREQIEQRLIAADQARRAALPKGIPAGMVPPHVSAAQMMMASDPMREPRRRSVVEDALEHGGSVLYSLNEGAP
jgi:hypothetical protein